MEEKNLVAAKGWTFSPEAPPGSEVQSVAVCPDGLRNEGVCELPSGRLASEGSLRGAGAGETAVSVHQEPR